VPKSALVKALAWLTVPALIGPVVGPPFGGFVTTYFDWRWIFWINVPFGLAGIVLAGFFMPEGRDRPPAPLDWRGFALLASGLSGLIFGFTIAGREVLPEPSAEVLMLAGAGLAFLYVAHARHAPHPLIDLRLLTVPTFLTSAGGGFLFRVGGGAIPFLLPLMLQLAFGLDPFASGSLTFVAAAGAIAMKFTAGPILRRFGFRRVLTVNALACAAFMASYGLFTAQTPHWLILAVLLAGGFFRSLQFTSLNAVAYADVEEAKMSQATALAAVAQQLALALGVALAAFLLEASRAVRGEAVLVQQDFAAAFFGMAVLVASCVLFHARLRPDAGVEVSGHRG
jgi:MFS family permease